MLKGLQMITSHSVKWILAGALIIPGLTGCSIFGGGNETEELAASEEGTEATPEGDSNAQAEATEGADAIGAEGNAMGMEGNTVGAESNTINDAAVAQAAEAAAGPAGGELPGSEIPPELLANDSAPMPPDPNTGNAAPGSAPMATGFSAPPPDVRVYYVNAASTILHNSPDASSQSVGSLHIGDPVLVKVEGNWANVINRGWVQLASLATGPVARGRTARAWN
jgi:hypothetical protein